MPKANHPLAPLLLLGSMISLTVGASIAKNLFAALGPGGTTFLRLTIAAFLLSLVSRAWRVRLNQRDLGLVFLYGAGLGAMNFFFYEAIVRLPIGIAIAIEFLGPLSISVFLSRSKLDFLWALLAAIGIALLLPLTQEQAPLDWLGVICALLAAAGWAFYIVVGKKAGKVGAANQVTTLGLFFGALVILPFGIKDASAILQRPDLLLSALAVGVLSSAIPYSLEMVALKHIDPKNFGILLSLEPAIGALAAFLFLGEHLRLIQLLAIALVICASVGSTVSSSRKNLRERLKVEVAAP